MGKQQKKRIVRLVIIMIVLFACLAAASMHFGTKYIEKQLLLSNESEAVDIAMLIKRNFTITDSEVSHMKSLDFNAMENDPINKRLMDTNDGVVLNNKISNIYVIILLNDDEIKYTTDEKTSKFFGYDVGTKLNGMWLLNGKFDEKGKFVVTERDDIYRYLEFCPSDKKIFESEKSFGLITEDAWGEFITGYTPLYTKEGNYVGILGVDMGLDKYHENVNAISNILLIAFIAITLLMIILFLVFYVKYMKAKEGQLYFEFYSRMSHDMRTPMNGILGIATLSKAEDNIEILKHNYEIIEESGQYMLGLINDTLDIQKLGTGRFKLEPKVRNMSEMLQSITSIIKSNARVKDIDVEIETMGIEATRYCYVDEIRLQQIVLNIVSNAIKFTPEKGKVFIKFENDGSREKVDHTKLIIQDTGIGMTKEFMNNHLFQPYAQERNSVTTQYGGTGLGLSIVKNLIDLMGGKIEVDSNPGQGSTFTIYLDFEEASKEDINRYLEEKKSTDIYNREELDGSRALLCEDHPLNVMVAQKMLEKFGVSVDVAHDGEEGVAMFKESTQGYYDFILMDIRMPKIDGLEATRRIRSLDRNDGKSIAIIAMTANAYEEDKDNCIEAGMNAHIGKPVDIAILYKTIVDVMGKRGK